MSSTTKRLIILLGITTVAAGGYVAYSFYKKKKEDNVHVEPAINNEPVEHDEEQKEDENDKEVQKFIFGDNIALMPEPTEIEKTEYTTKAEVYDTADETDISEDTETWEAFNISKEYDEYRKKNKNKIIVLPEGNIEYTWNREIGNDPDVPDVCYDEEELYYFTGDDTLTDEDGNIIDEEQYLGVKPRQFGWFENDKEEIYIRNNPLERDFRVNKVQASRDAYFPD